MAEFKLPTELVDLPSKGLVYPETHPAASGKVEIKYMTSKEEDIITNINYIEKGTVIDKLMESLIKTPNLKYSDLVMGDRNALLIAARILGYGNMYTFTYQNKQYTVDLSKLEPTPIDETKLSREKSEFDFELPSTGTKITFKLLTGKDEDLIDKEVNALKKINKDSNASGSTRMKFTITSVEGDSTRGTINSFVDNHLIARDALALREEIRKVSPDISMKLVPEGEEEEILVPITATFLYPDLG